MNNITNTDLMEQIFQKIKENNRIIIFRHFRNDGDCVGACRGLQEILRASFPEKEIYSFEEKPSDYLAFLGPDDAPIPAEEYKTALGIVLDTASEDRIADKNYTLCKDLIKIDHHIPLETYGSIAWVEEERSSCCEMIVKFYDYFRDQLTLNSAAATYLYTGMVTDSGRFKYEGVTGDTLRLAAILLDAGIDTQTLYAQLYLDDFEMLKFEAYIYEHMQITDNGVAYIFVDKAMQEKFQLTQEQASSCVGTLDGIRGAICWLAFIENDGGESIRVRLRSRFVSINGVAERYHGGGHAMASGATVYSLEEMQQLIQDADATVKEYKETHEGWL